MNDYIIKVKNLHKSYQNGIKNVEVLKGIDFEVRHGQIFCVQGPSGAGKSTLLNLIGMLDEPSEGEILFEGRDISKFNERKISEFRNKRLGFVFQFYHLLPEFTAFENVILPALVNDGGKKKEVIGFAKKIFEDLGLAQRMSFKPNQLSGGEQQRVAIARALINKPDILLCDEPTGNLDSDNGAKILNILKNLSRESKTTVILVTHNTEVARACDIIVYLKDGILVN